MTQVSKIFKFIMYADDTTLSTILSVFNSDNKQVNMEEKINLELSKNSEWLVVNKLSLNIAKNKFTIFHTIQKRINNITIKIVNTVIEKVPDFNFLGLILNENLSWKSHCDKISNSISKSLGILNALKHILLEEIKVMLYNSMIASHINYCILAWGYEFKRITKLQKKAMRIISVSKYNAHTCPIFKRLKLLKIEDIIKLNETKFYYKYENGNLPDFFFKKKTWFSAWIMKYTIITQEQKIMYSLLEQTTNMQKSV